MARWRGTGDTGTEVAIHAKWSRKALLLRLRPASLGLTDAEAHGYAGSVQAGWEGRAIPGTRRSKC